MRRPERFVGSLARTLKPSVFGTLESALARRAATGQPLAPLHIGDTCYPPPAAARAELEDTDRAARELARYGPTAGLPALLTALAAHETAALGTDVDASCILFGGGGTYAFGAVARAVLDPGDEVLLISPYWPGAHSIFTAVGAQVREVPRGASPNPVALGAALEAAVTKRTRALYFVSPNNPDGFVFGDEYLKVFQAFAEAHDLFVFADEVYAEGYATAPLRPFAATDSGHAFARTATIRSFSKSHGLSGARLGYVVAPPAVVAYARRVSLFQLFSVPLPLQRMALAARRAPASWLAGAQEFQRRHRAITLDVLTASDLALAYAEPEGACYVFLDFTRVLERHGGKVTLQEVLERCVDHGVLLCPGHAFGDGFESHARLCFTAAPEAELRAGLAALVAAVSSLAI
jgi:aspartate/methionine/tyrosine aminotransferase